MKLFELIIDWLLNFINQPRHRIGGPPKSKIVMAALALRTADCFPWPGILARKPNCFDTGKVNVWTQQSSFIYIYIIIYYLLFWFRGIGLRVISAWYVSTFQCWWLAGNAVLLCLQLGFAKWLVVSQQSCHCRGAHAIDIRITST